MTEKNADIDCPLCGHRFREQELACHTGCPFGDNCQLACCPRCGYQIVRETKTVQWLRRFLRREQND